MRRLFCYGIIGRVKVARIVSRIVSIAAGILLLPRQCDMACYVRIILQEES